MAVHFYRAERVGVASSRLMNRSYVNRDHTYFVSLSLADKVDLDFMMKPRAEVA